MTLFSSHNPLPDAACSLPDAYAADAAYAPRVTAPAQPVASRVPVVDLAEAYVPFVWHHAVPLTDAPEHNDVAPSLHHAVPLTVGLNTGNADAVRVLGPALHNAAVSPPAVSAACAQNGCVATVGRAAVLTAAF